MEKAKSQENDRDRRGELDGIDIRAGPESDLGEEEKEDLFMTKGNGHAEGLADDEGVDRDDEGNANSQDEGNVDADLLRQEKLRNSVPLPSPSPCSSFCYELYMVRTQNEVEIDLRRQPIEAGNPWRAGWGGTNESPKEPP